MRLFAPLALMLAATMVPQSASAQASSEPTPEDAQRFIQTVLSQGATRANFVGLKFDKIMDAGWNCGGMSVCTLTVDRSGIAYWESSPDVCSTTISVAVEVSSWRDDHALVALREAPRTTLSWKTISAAGVSGSQISLSGGTRISTFYFATEEVAGRVQKAFQLLIRTCDPTRGLGF
jgi:hypothetical protein